MREGEHGAEYVLAWAAETADGRDIVLTKVDIDNLLRAKAAIYAGYTVLCASVGVDPAEVEQVLIGGAFGQYINIEKAIQIGLLPDLPWDRFQFLGNTSVKGAYLALLSREARRQVSSGCRQDDLPGAVGRQRVLSQLHVCALPAPYRDHALPFRPGDLWRTAGPLR